MLYCEWTSSAAPTIDTGRRHTLRHTNHLLSRLASTISAKLSPLKQQIWDLVILNRELCLEMNRNFQNQLFVFTTWIVGLFIWALRLLAWGKKNIKTQNTISFKMICKAWEMGNPETFFKLSQLLCLKVRDNLLSRCFTALGLSPITVWICVI